MLAAFDPLTEPRSSSIASKEVVAYCNTAYCGDSTHSLRCLMCIGQIVRLSTLTSICLQFLQQTALCSTGNPSLPSQLEQDPQVVEQDETRDKTLEEDLQVVEQDETSLFQISRTTSFGSDRVFPKVDVVGDSGGLLEVPVTQGASSVEMQSEGSTAQGIQVQKSDQAAMAASVAAMAKEVSTMAAAVASMSRPCEFRESAPKPDSERGISDSSFASPSAANEDSKVPAGSFNGLAGTSSSYDAGLGELRGLEKDVKALETADMDYAANKTMGAATLYAKKVRAEFNAAAARKDAAIDDTRAAQAEAYAAKKKGYEKAFAELKMEAVKDALKRREQNAMTYLDTQAAAAAIVAGAAKGTAHR